MLQTQISKTKKKYSTHFALEDFYIIKHDNIRKLNICKSKAHQPEQ